MADAKLFQSGPIITTIPKLRYYQDIDRLIVFGKYDLLKFDISEFGNDISMDDKKLLEARKTYCTTYYVYSGEPQLVIGNCLILSGIQDIAVSEFAVQQNVIVPQLGVTQPIETGQNDRQISISFIFNEFLSRAEPAKTVIYKVGNNEYKFFIDLYSFIHMLRSFSIVPVYSKHIRALIDPNYKDVSVGDENKYIGFGSIFDKNAMTMCQVTNVNIRYLQASQGSFIVSLQLLPVEFSAIGGINLGVEFADYKDGKTFSKKQYMFESESQYAFVADKRKQAYERFRSGTGSNINARQIALVYNKNQLARGIFGTLLTAVYPLISNNIDINQIHYNITLQQVEALVNKFKNTFSDSTFVKTYIDQQQNLIQEFKKPENKALTQQYVIPLVSHTNADKFEMRTVSLNGIDISYKNFFQTHNLQKNQTKVRQFMGSSGMSIDITLQARISQNMYKLLESPNGTVNTSVIDKFDIGVAARLLQLRRLVSLLNSMSSEFDVVHSFNVSDFLNMFGIDTVAINQVDVQLNKGTEDLYSVRLSMTEIKDVYKYQIEKNNSKRENIGKNLDVTSLEYLVVKYISAKTKISKAVEQQANEIKVVIKEHVGSNNNKINESVYSSIAKVLASKYTIGVPQLAANQQLQAVIGAVEDFIFTVKIQPKSNVSSPSITLRNLQLIDGTVVSSATVLVRMLVESAIQAHNLMHSYMYGILPSQDIEVRHITELVTVSGFTDICILYTDEDNILLKQGQFEAIKSWFFKLFDSDDSSSIEQVKRISAIQQMQTDTIVFQTGSNSQTRLQNKATVESIYEKQFSANDKYNVYNILKILVDRQTHVSFKLNSTVAKQLVEQFKPEYTSTKKLFNELCSIKNDSMWQYRQIQNLLFGYKSLININKLYFGRAFGQTTTDVIKLIAVQNNEFLTQHYGPQSKNLTYNISNLVGTHKVFFTNNSFKLTDYAEAYIHARSIQYLITYMMHQPSDMFTNQLQQYIQWQFVQKSSELADSQIMLRQQQIQQSKAQDDILSSSGLIYAVKTGTSSNQALYKYNVVNDLKIYDTLNTTSINNVISTVLSQFYAIQYLAYYTLKTHPDYNKNVSGEHPFGTETDYITAYAGFLNNINKQSTTEQIVSAITSYANTVNQFNELADFLTLGTEGQLNISNSCSSQINQLKNAVQELMQQINTGTVENIAINSVADIHNIINKLLGTDQGQQNSSIVDNITTILNAQYTITWQFYTGMPYVANYITAGIIELLQLSKLISKGQNISISPYEVPYAHMLIRMAQYYVQYMQQYHTTGSSEYVLQLSTEYATTTDYINELQQKHYQQLTQFSGSVVFQTLFTHYALIGQSVQVQQKTLTSWQSEAAVDILNDLLQFQLYYIPSEIQVGNTMYKTVVEIIKNRFKNQLAVMEEYTKIDAKQLANVAVWSLIKKPDRLNEYYRNIDQQRLNEMKRDQTAALAQILSVAGLGSTKDEQQKNTKISQLVNQDKGVQHYVIDPEYLKNAQSIDEARFMLSPTLAVSNLDMKKNTNAVLTVVDHIEENYAQFDNSLRGLFDNIQSKSSKIFKSQSVENAEQQFKKVTEILVKGNIVREWDVNQIPTMYLVYQVSQLQQFYQPYTKTQPRQFMNIILFSTSGEPYIVTHTQILDVAIVREDRNPVDVQTVTIPGVLTNTATWMQYAFAIMENQFNKHTIQLANTFQSALQPGVDVEIWLGYGPYQQNYKKQFAGFIRSVQQNKDGTLTLICESYGAQLVRHVFDSESTIGYVNNDPRNIVVTQLEQTKSNALGYSVSNNQQIFEIVQASLDSVDKMIFRDRLKYITKAMSRMADNVYYNLTYYNPENDLKKIREQGATSIQEAYALQLSQNNPQKSTGFLSQLVHLAGKYVVKPGYTAWKVITDQLLLSPDFIQQVEPIMELGQQRLFFGKRTWPFMYAYETTDQTSPDLMFKDLTQLPTVEVSFNIPKIVTMPRGRTQIDWFTVLTGKTTDGTVVFNLQEQSDNDTDEYGLNEGDGSSNGGTGGGGSSGGSGSQGGEGTQGQGQTSGGIFGTLFAQQLTGQNPADSSAVSQLVRTAAQKQIDLKPLLLGTYPSNDLLHVYIRQLGTIGINIPQEANYELISKLATDNLLKLFTVDTSVIQLPTSDILLSQLIGVVHITHAVDAMVEQIYYSTTNIGNDDDNSNKLELSKYMLLTYSFLINQKGALYDILEDVLGVKNSPSSISSALNELLSALMSVQPNGSLGINTYKEIGKSKQLKQLFDAMFGPINENEEKAKVLTLSIEKLQNEFIVMKTFVKDVLEQTQYVVKSGNDQKPLWLTINTPNGSIPLISLITTEYYLKLMRYNLTSYFDILGEQYDSSHTGAYQEGLESRYSTNVISDLLDWVNQLKNKPWLLSLATGAISQYVLSMALSSSTAIEAKVSDVAHNVSFKVKLDKLLRNSWISQNMQELTQQEIEVQFNMYHYYTDKGGPLKFEADRLIESVWTLLVGSPLIKGAETQTIVTLPRVLTIASLGVAIQKQLVDLDVGYITYNKVVDGVVKQEVSHVTLETLNNIIKLVNTRDPNNGDVVQVSGNWYHMTTNMLEDITNKVLQKQLTSQVALVILSKVYELIGQMFVNSEVMQKIVEKTISTKQFSSYNETSTKIEQCLKFIDQQLGNYILKDAGSIQEKATRFTAMAYYWYSAISQLSLYKINE